MLNKQQSFAVLSVCLFVGVCVRMVAHVVDSPSRSLARAFLVLGLIVQFVFASTSAGANPESVNDVLELTGDTFPTFITSHDTTVVEFYQPW